jgi:hypothetical protein
MTRNSDSPTLAFGESRKPTSPRISYTNGSADAVPLTAVSVADGELIVGIGVEADMGFHPRAHATTQTQTSMALTHRAS